MTRPLTEKQLRFVEAYTGPSEGNATDAARRAGYAHPTTQGPRMLEHVGICAAIEERTAALREQGIADTLERQRFLTAVMRGELGEPETNLAGEVVGEVPPKIRDRIKACETLGKMQGDFVQQHAVSVQAVAPIDVPVHQATEELRLLRGGKK